MTVMLIGNSLTAGNLGIPYSHYLNLPESYRVVNRGRDGDTVRGIRSRLDDAIQGDGPDVLVVQTGANDILLPEMAARGGSWTAFVAEMTGRGSIPTPNPEEFTSIYSELLETGVSWGIARIIAVTIPPLGENLESDLNARRRALNDRIRHVIANVDVVLADVAAMFEKELSALAPVSDWFFTNPEDFAADIRRVRKDKGSTSLSEERGLYLTMDGAHLNERGAALMGRIVSEAILGHLAQGQAGS